MLLGFVPFRRLSLLHLEFDAGWTSQSAPSSKRMQAIPLVGSLCGVRENVRMCGGLATTMYFSNVLPNHDELRAFAMNFRVGTELFSYGPFSLRADVFGRMAFAYQWLGQALINALDRPVPFAAGIAVMIQRSLD